MRTELREAVGDAAKNVGGRSVKDLADDLRELASPIERADKIGAAIKRAADLSGLEYWRCFNIWYGKAKQITPEECEQVAAALDKKLRADRRNELQELWTRLVRLESALAQTDPDFHRETLSAIKGQRISGWF